MIISIIKPEGKYGWFSNISSYKINYKGKIYNSVEELFQCLRFLNYPDIQEKIKEHGGYYRAKITADHSQNDLDPDDKWDDEEDVDLMRLCLKLKLKQHPELKEWLLETGDEEIIEERTLVSSYSGRFWGVTNILGKIEGQNRLGKLWMELREQLKSEDKQLKGSKENGELYREKLDEKLEHKIE